MARRSGWSRHARGNAHAVVLLIVVFVVAAIGVYLLIAGAVALVAWLLVVAFKKPAMSTSNHRLHSGGRAEHALPGPRAC